MTDTPDTSSRYTHDELRAAVAQALREAAALPEWQQAKGFIYSGSYRISWDGYNFALSFSDARHGFVTLHKSESAARKAAQDHNETRILALIPADAAETERDALAAKLEMAVGALARLSTAEVHGDDGEAWGERLSATIAGREVLARMAYARATLAALKETYNDMAKTQEHDAASVEVADWRPRRTKTEGGYNG